MAKNKYKQEKFKGTHSCGHEAKIIIGGYSDEYRAEQASLQFESPCYDCQEKEKQEKRAAEAERLAKEAAENFLPELTGSPKQIQWAEQIRGEFIEFLAQVKEDFPSFEKAFNREYSDKNREDIMTRGEPDMFDFNKIRVSIMFRFEKALENMMKSEDSAKIYIDLRDLSKVKIDKGILNSLSTGSIFSTSSSFYERYETFINTYNPTEDAIIEKEIIEETITKPENFNGVIVEVLNKVEGIVVNSVKDEDLIAIVKARGYRWSGTAWIKKLDEFTGSGLERTAEIIHRLLEKGFGVKTNDTEALSKAKASEVSKEITKWVKFKESKNKFFIAKGDHYDELKAVKFMKYKEGFFYIDVEYYQELEDWAEHNGYGISKIAKIKMESLKRTITEEIVSVEEKIEEKKNVSDILKSDRSVLEDLKDD